MVKTAAGENATMEIFLSANHRRGLGWLSRFYKKKISNHFIFTYTLYFNDISSMTTMDPAQFDETI